MEYDVVQTRRTEGIERLRIEVNLMMKKEWIPIGGVATTDHFYLQAMVKK